MMRVCLHLWLSILWLNVKGSLQQHDPTCEVAVMDTRLFVAGLLPQNQPIQAGHKLHFHCSDGYKLQGSKEIECLQTGQWSSPFPVCSAIKCDAPASIDHGRVSDNRQEYKENEELNFVCDEGYTPRDKRPSKCTQSGKRAEWSPTPECIEIKCELVLPSERSTYNPPNKNVFSPGETVQVTCGETDWVLNHQTTKAVITCKDDGEWTSRPECSEVFCNDPTRDQQVSYWYATSEQKRLHGTVSYRCNPGFEKPWGAWAQCTRDGWTPKPLCAGTTCEKHIIENANIIQNDKSSYRNGESVMYRCFNGDKETFSLTCQQGRWNGIRTCPEYCKKLQDDKITLNPTQPKERFADGDTLHYRCKADTKEGTATCTNGRWFKTVECQDLGCSYPPFLDNGDYLASKTQFAHNERLEYRCQSYHVMEGGPYKTCKNGIWTGEMRCLKYCTVSQYDMDDNNIDFIRTGLDKLYSLHADHITFTCKRGFERVGNVEMQQRCNDGEITLPTCQRRQ